MSNAWDGALQEVPVFDSILFNMSLHGKDIPSIIVFISCRKPYTIFILIGNIGNYYSAYSKLDLYCAAYRYV